MKKYLSLLLLLLPTMAFVTSCSDESDLPDVDFDVNFENVTTIDNVLYVVQGESFEITSIDVISNDGKNAMITNANYYWDYQFIGSSIEPPFGFKIEVTPEASLGKHVLQIDCPLFVQDKEPATALVSFAVNVVASLDDLPDQGVSTVKVHTTTAITDK